MVNTVATNKSKYTNADYLMAIAAHKLQVKIGNPSTRDFITIVTNNMLPNCPITKADILTAEHIFGRDVGSIKGKTVRHPPCHVSTYTEPLPRDILDQYWNVTVAGDVMFVNGLPFLVTISCNIHFGMVEARKDTKGPTLVKGIKYVCDIYKQGSFKVDLILMDGQFEPLQGDIPSLGLCLNDVAVDEHVGEAERYIWTIKERCQSACNVLPFKKIPGCMVIEMVRQAAFWPNAFPRKKGVSLTLSPRTIVTG